MYFINTLMKLVIKDPLNNYLSTNAATCEYLH